MKQKALSSFYMHFRVNKDVGGIMNGIPAYDKKSSKKVQYSRPFSQTRDAGNKIARFHPGHNAALKNLSFHWKTVLFKLGQKQPKYSIRLVIIILFFFFFLLQHFKTQWKRVNKTTANQQHFVLKISQCEIDYHKFNCWCNCFLCNLFEENKFETWNWFAKFYCCWYNLYIIWCN